MSGSAVQGGAGITRQTFSTADDVCGDFHVQRVNGKYNARKHGRKRVAQHAVDGDGEEDGDGSVEGDVDDVITKGPQLVKIVVESKGYGCERAVAEVGAWLDHVAAP